MNTETRQELSDRGRPRIQAAVFDIGMVLLKFDFQKSVERIWKKCRVPSHQMLEVLWKSEITLQYERGGISTGEFVEKGMALLGFQGEAHEFLDAWTDIFTPNPLMVDRALRWKRAGLPIYVLSNTCEAHIEFFKGKYDFFKELDGEIYSCREGMAKPEAGIYSRLLERYGLEPSGTLYLDDLLENVEGARKMGLEGVHYREENSLLQELGRYGLE